ncbi:MAG: dihydroorotase, partial [Dysgonamonadaceae bacterium]
MILLYKATIINDGKRYVGSVLIEHERISQIYIDDVPDQIVNNSEVFDSQGLYLIPGVIDD